MKPVVIALAVLFLVLQYKLWFEKGGVSEVWRLRNAIETQSQQNKEFAERNKALEAEVNDLKSGQAAVEERARNDLGMVKPNEVFYQIVPESK